MPDMKKRNGYIPWICFLSFVLFISCKKEYSFEGGLQAGYYIEGSPGNCSPAVLSGFYTAGTPTNSGNTLQLTVHVTTAGNYTIYTLPANGISFTASGNFADTGTRVVTLQCSGTPDSAGTFLIKIPGAGGCSVTLVVSKKAPAQYTLAGDPADCSGRLLSGTFTMGKAINAANNITLQVIVNTPGDYTITTDTIDGISFSAMGHFTTIGAQKVVLQGTGIPGGPGLEYFNVKADSSRCSFSIPVQDAEPIATYVLQSGVGASGFVCAPQSVQGIFAAGIALTSSNTITISPFATLPGNYTISTARINGMIFSASGNFPAAGAYSVVLKGNGTPLSSGIFTFTPMIVGPAPIGGQACDVSLTVQ